MFVCFSCAEGPGFEPRVGSSRTFKIDFHQQKLSSLLITCDVKLKGAFYSLYCAKTIKDPVHSGMSRAFCFPQYSALSTSHPLALYRM